MLILEEEKIDEGCEIIWGSVYSILSFVEYKRNVRYDFNRVKICYVYIGGKKRYKTKFVVWE